MQEDAFKSGRSGEDDVNHSSVGDGLALKLEKVEAQIKESEEGKERERLDKGTARLATAVAEARKDISQNSYVELESSIAYARGVGVSQEEILFAEQRLDELRKEMDLKQEALSELEVSYDISYDFNNFCFSSIY
jgi:shikimate kinase